MSVTISCAAYVYDRTLYRASVSFVVVECYGFRRHSATNSKYDKFSDNAYFRGRGWNWVDPLKEINAAVVGLQNGVLSMQDVAANYGRDVEETFSALRVKERWPNSLACLWRLSRLAINSPLIRYHRR